MSLNFNISFSVTASGILPMTYQWQSGSTNLSNTSRITGSQEVVASDSQSLFINTVQFSDTGSYRVLVSNSEASAISDYATLYVIYNLYPPLVVIQPNNILVPDGYTASFSASAIGSRPMSFQWYSGSTALVDDGRITGSQTAFLYFSSTVTSDTGSYRVYVSNQTGSSYSNYVSMSFRPNYITSSAVSSASFILGLSAGSLIDEPYIEVGNTIIVGLESGSLTTAIFETSGVFDSQSIEIGLYSSSVYQTIFSDSSSFDSASIEIGLYSSSVYQTIFSESSSFDSQSIEIGLYSSSVYAVVSVYEIPVEILTSIDVGLVSGSLEG